MNGIINTSQQQKEDDGEKVSPLSSLSLPSLDTYEEISRELEENRMKMRETFGYSLDEFDFKMEENLKPSANFAQELLHLIQTNLEPFESSHCFGQHGFYKFQFRFSAYIDRFEVIYSFQNR